jgi:hypothetical protein
MSTKVAVKNILPEIPITLAVVMGDNVIRFGELERELATAIARVKCADEGGDTKRFLELVGKYKMLSLGHLIDEAQKEFNGRNFAWIDFDALKRLKDKRNAIHDALVDGFDGTLTWQASGRRKHRPIDYGELLLLRECVVRTIAQINKGSLDYKR